MDRDQSQVGSSLAADAASSVTTVADQNLYHGLKDKEFCYVFDAPNSGKSSLSHRVRSKLAAEGFGCVAVDLNEFKVDGELSDWNHQLFATIIQDLKLEHRLQANNYAQLIDLIDAIWGATDYDIVIFIDAFEQILKQDSIKQNWLEAIANWDLRRESKPEYARLNFCLLGVVNTEELDTGAGLGLFGVGRKISLPPWTIAQVKPLAVEIAPFCKNPRAILEAILAWTGGQPLLTHKLCQAIALNQRFIDREQEAEVVQQLAGQLFADLDNDPACSEHFRRIQRRLWCSRRGVVDLLFVYLKLLHYDGIAAEDSSLHSELHFIGIARRQNNTLKVYNRIYRQLFDFDWALRQIQALRSHYNPFSQAYQGWLKSGGKDYAWLLRGEALLQAQTWAETKKLSEPESQFLALSQQWEQRETQTNLDLAKIAVESEAKKHELAQNIQQEIKRVWLEMEDANQDLQQISRQNRWFIYTAMAAIALLTVIGSTKSVAAVWLSAIVCLGIFIGYLFKYQRITKDLQKNINLRKNLIVSFENFWQTHQYETGYSGVSLTQLEPSDADIERLQSLKKSRQSISLIVCSFVVLAVIFFGLGYIITASLFDDPMTILRELAEPFLPFLTIILVMVGGLMGLMIWLFLQTYKQIEQPQVELNDDLDAKINHNLIENNNPLVSQLQQQEIEQQSTSYPAIESNNGRN